MLITGLDLTFGRSSLGNVSKSANSTTLSPATTRLTISTIFLPTEGPTTASNCTSRSNRSKLIIGKQPARMIFFPFGARFMASIMRFSVGPLTAQVLKISISDSVWEFASWYPACLRHLLELRYLRCLKSSRSYE